MANDVHSSLPSPRVVAVRAMANLGALPVALEVVAGFEGLDRTIAHPRIQKSGLALVGHYEGLSPDRAQVLGHTEMTFLGGMEPAKHDAAVQGFFAQGLCCVVVTAGGTVGEMMLAAADAHGCPVLRTEARSSATINAIHGFLDEQLAPRTRVHGVFVDVYGVGILLLGRSGIGKSECALELVQRGHRLVADDVVECSLRSPTAIYGTSNPLLKNHLEVRGLGVLNIKDLFGVAAVCDVKKVDLVVQLLGREDDHEDPLDRLGIDDEWFEILGVQCPLRRVPVRSGKNTASTVEVGARNELLRQAGHHSARSFHAQLAAALGVPDPSTEAGGAQ